MNINDTNITAMSAGSVIVYGPRGCGKTFHAPALAKFFGCSSYSDAPVSLYRDLQTPGGLARFKARGVLMLTHLAPPDELSGSRRILHLRDALRLAGIPTHGKAVDL